MDWNVTIPDTTTIMTAFGCLMDGDGPGVELYSTPDVCPILSQCHSKDVVRWGSVRGHHSVEFCTIRSRASCCYNKKAGGVNGSGYDLLDLVVEIL